MQSLERNNFRKDKGRAFEILFSNNVIDAKFSRNGKFISCLVHEKKYSLIIFDAEYGTEYARIKLNSEPMDFICFDNEGINYAIAVFRSSAFLWNLDSGEDCGRLNISVSASLVTGINNYALSNDGMFFAFTAFDKTATLSNASFARIFNIKEGNKVYESKHGYTNNTAENICFNHDNKYAVITINGPSSGLILQILKQSTDNTYYIVDVLQTTVGNTHEIKFHPKNNILYMVEKAGYFVVNKIKYEKKGAIIVYDLENRRIQKFLRPNQEKEGAWNLEFNNNGSLFLTKSVLGFKVFDNKDGKLVKDVSKEAIDNIQIQSASLDPLYNYVLVVLSDNTVRNDRIFSNSQDELFEVDDYEEDCKQEGFLAVSEKKNKQYQSFNLPGCLFFIVSVFAAFLMLYLGVSTEFVYFVFFIGLVIIIAPMFFSKPSQQVSNKGSSEDER